MSGVKLGTKQLLNWSMHSMPLDNTKLLSKYLSGSLAAQGVSSELKNRVKASLEVTKGKVCELLLYYCGIIRTNELSKSYGKNSILIHGCSQSINE